MIPYASASLICSQSTSSPAPLTQRPLPLDPPTVHLLFLCNKSDTFWDGSNGMSQNGSNMYRIEFYSTRYFLNNLARIPPVPELSKIMGETAA